jgi:hypothetical protein
MIKHVNIWKFVVIILVVVMSLKQALCAKGCVPHLHKQCPQRSNVQGDCFAIFKATRQKVFEFGVIFFHLKLI